MSGLLIAHVFLQVLALGGGRRRAHHAVGLVFVIPSFVAWAAARLQLGDAFTARAEARRLVTHGLYAHVRHPIYVAGLVATFGRRAPRMLAPAESPGAAPLPSRLFAALPREIVLISFEPDDAHAQRRTTGERYAGRLLRGTNSRFGREGQIGE